MTGHKDVTDALGDELSPYVIFSVFLKWEILNSTTLTMNYVPIEYINYIAELNHTQPDNGELMLVTMLFTEYYQKKETGNYKIKLDESKYLQLGMQFVWFCQLEQLRRQGGIDHLHAIKLFNPNVKTQFFISPCTEEIKAMIPRLSALNVDVIHSQATLK